jgi:hypothetical protein
LSPILWEQRDDSPLETLENTNKVANFLERLILEQLKTYNITEDAPKTEDEKQI